MGDNDESNECKSQIGLFEVVSFVQLRQSLIDLAILPSLWS